MSGEPQSLFRRLTAFTCVVAAVVCATALADDCAERYPSAGCAERYPHAPCGGSTCQGGCASCRHGFRCAEKKYNAERPEPRKPEAGPLEAPAGGFAAPPRVGSFAGPSNGLGMPGMSIELPALKLELPRIKFNGATRYRTNSRMLIDEDVAPFVRDVREEFSFESGRLEPRKPEAGPLEGPPKPEAGPYESPGKAPEGGPLCPPRIPRSVCPHGCAQHAPSQGPRGPSASPPNPAAPAGDVGWQDSQRFEQAEAESLRRLEEAERRLDEKLLRVQNTLDQLTNLTQQKRQPAPLPGSADFAKETAGMPRHLPPVDPRAQSIQQANYLTVDRSSRAATPIRLPRP